MSRLGIPCLIYIAFAVQGICSHWLPAGTGTPQLLLVLLVWLIGRGTAGYEILLGAGLGLLADVLEPEGLGRNYLLYAAAAWWAAKSLDRPGQRPAWGRALWILALNSFCIPFLSALMRGLSRNLPVDFHVLFSNSWTSCAGTVLVGALWYGALRLWQRQSAGRADPSSDPFSKNRWNMLTN